MAAQRAALHRHLPAHGAEFGRVRTIPAHLPLEGAARPGQFPGQFGEHLRLRALPGVHVGIRRAVRVPGPAVQARLTGLPHLIDAAELVVEVDGAAAHLRHVRVHGLQGRGEGVPLVEPQRLGGHEVTLVVHHHVDVQVAFPDPRDPVLQHFRVRARGQPGALVGGAFAVGDGGGVDAHVGFHGLHRQGRLAHQVGDLLATPGRPLRVAGQRRAGRARLGAVAFQRGGVVAPVVGAAHRVVIGVAHPVELNAVHVVVLHDADVHIPDVLGGVRVTGVEQPVGPAAGGAVVLDHQPEVPARGVQAVLVEGVRGVFRGREAVPDGGGDDPGVHLDTLRVRLGDQVGERIEPGRHGGVVGAGHGGVVAVAVAAPPHLGEQHVHVRGLRVGHEFVDLLGRF